MNINRNHPRRPWRRLVAGCLAMVAMTTALMGTSLAPASADPDSADSGGPFGTWSVAGYDWAALDREARVIARSSDTNLVFRHVARSFLRDATLTLDIPRSDWPDDLRWYPGGLDYVSPKGLVVVRPHAGWPEQSGDCRGGSVTWTVTPLARVQRIAIEHVDCEPGEQIAVRIRGLATPRNPGRYRFRASVEQDLASTSVVGLRVYPKPSTRLSVSLPRKVQFNEPVTLVVTARKLDGRIDRSYRGGVALLSEGPGCVFDGGYAYTVFDFAAADAGVREIPVVLKTEGYRVVARDVGGEARPGRSKSFTVQGVPDDYVPVCPISFH